MGWRGVLIAGVAGTMIALGSPGASAKDQAGKQGAVVAGPADEVVLAPFTDHYEMRINKPADVVWSHLKELYVEGRRMREQGFEVKRLEGDLTAYLGAVRGVHPDNKDRPEVTIKVSAIDEKARLLSLQIELENPVPVYVVHQVRPDGPNASIYQNIIQTKWPVKKPDGGTLTPDYVRQKMKADVAAHNAEVAAIMEREKVIIEALD